MSIRIASAFLLAMVLIAPLQAEVVLVDFGVSDSPDYTSVTPNEVQSGYEDFSLDPRFNGVDGLFDFVNPGTHVRPSQDYSNATIEMRGTANGMSFYDLAQDVNHAMGDLLEDYIHVIQGDIFIKMSGLAAGNYEVTTYHHRADMEEAALLFDIYVATNGGPEVLRREDVDTSFGYEPETISTATFRFDTNGVDDVFIKFDGGGSGADLINPALNGFEVRSVPEAAGWKLIVAGLTLLVSRFSWVRWVRMKPS